MSRQPAGSAFFDRIPKDFDPNGCKTLYDEWASSYNVDLNDASQGYIAPLQTAKAVLKFGGNIHGALLDAGCGTGLSGVALREAGAKTIDGLDVSPGMLKVAKQTGVYRSLKTSDLTKELSIEAGTYDVVTCVGTLTPGHVGPTPVLREFIRVLKQGGILAATVRETTWIEGGFKTEVEKMEKDKVAEVLSTNLEPYREAQNAHAIMLVMKKI